MKRSNIVLKTMLVFACAIFSGSASGMFKELEKIIQQTYIEPKGERAIRGEQPRQFEFEDPKERIKARPDTEGLGYWLVTNNFGETITFHPQGGKPISLTHNPSETTKRLWHIVPRGPSFNFTITIDTRGKEKPQDQDNYAWKSISKKNKYHWLHIYKTDEGNMGVDRYDKKRQTSASIIRPHLAARKATYVKDEKRKAKNDSSGLPYWVVSNETGEIITFYPKKGQPISLVYNPVTNKALHKVPRANSFDFTLRMYWRKYRFRKKIKISSHYIRIYKIKKPGQEIPAIKIERYARLPEGLEYIKKPPKTWVFKVLREIKRKPDPYAKRVKEKKPKKRIKKVKKPVKKKKKKKKVPPRKKVPKKVKKKKPKKRVKEKLVKKKRRKKKLSQEEKKRRAEERKRRAEERRKALEKKEAEEAWKEVKEEKDPEKGLKELMEKFGL